MRKVSSAPVMSSSTKASGRKTQTAASGVPVPNLKLRLRLGERSPGSPRGVGTPLMKRAPSSSVTVRSPQPTVQGATVVAAAGACSSPRGEGKYPARANPLINRGKSPKKAALTSARKTSFPGQGRQERQSGQDSRRSSGITSHAKDYASLAKHTTLRRFSDCSTDCGQSSTLSLRSEGAFSLQHANAQAPELNPAARSGQVSNLMTLSSSSKNSQCSSMSSLTPTLDASYAGFAMASKVDVTSAEEVPEDCSLLSDANIIEKDATDATAEATLDSMLRTTQGLIRAAHAIMAPPVPTSGAPLPGSQSARAVRSASKKPSCVFLSPRQTRRATVYSPRYAAEVEELRSRVNHLESELQKLRPSAAPSENPIALRMLLSEWERQLTEARVQQEEANGDFKDIRKQLCNLMVHVASLSASCEHGGSSGTAQTARMPVSYAPAPASHLWQARAAARYTKSTPCMNGHVNLHVATVAPHLRSNASMPSSLSTPGLPVPGAAANSSLLQRVNSATARRLQSLSLQGACQRFSISSSGSAS